MQTEENQILKAKTYLDEADVLMSRRKPDEALPLYNKAEAILNGLVDRDAVLKLKVNCFESKAGAYKIYGMEADCKRSLKKAVQIRRDLVFDSKKEWNESNASIAMDLSIIGENEKALAYADKAIGSCCDGEGRISATHLFSLAQVYRKDMDRNYLKVKKLLIAALLGRKYKDYLPNVNYQLTLYYLLAEIMHSYEHNDEEAMFILTNAWDVIQEMGIEDCAPKEAAQIAICAKDICALTLDAKLTEDHAEYTWLHRIGEVFGRHIDKGNTEYYVVKSYVELYAVDYSFTLKFGAPVTIERVVKCAELMKSLTADPSDNGNALWLEGCVLLKLGKTRESEAKGIRRIKSSIRLLKKVTTRESVNMIPVGEGLVADFHFKREEYDVAAEWYQAAIKDLATATCDPEIKADKDKRYADRLKECQKHI
ncbi:MAG: hypothetical protein LBT59_26555 [Clostridiales bacterium]|nr:hypothetical protein [Clostridiales bacterium]